jgi:threonine/homoserine/homoserine lactone efflux protein
LFFNAFLPLFTSPTAVCLPQITLFGVIFSGRAVILDSGLAILAYKITRLFATWNVPNYRQGICGVLYMIRGSALAMANNG